MMGSHPRKLSCGLKRNQFKKGSYLPDIANQKALERSFEAKTAVTKIWTEILDKLLDIYAEVKG